MGLFSGFADLLDNLWSDIGKGVDDLTGKTDVKKANQIAEEQLAQQNKTLAEAEARRKKAELDSEAEAKRAEQERLNAKSVSKKSVTGSNWGRFIK